MIIALLIWAFFLISFWILGSGLVYLLTRNEKVRFSLDWADTAFFGFVLSEIFSLWMSLFFPLNGLVQSIYTGFVLLVLVVLVYKKQLRPPAFGLKPISIPMILFVVSLVLILINSTNRSVNPDSGIYHAQTIHWIETYRVVPGLGNIHSRLAYNSAWLVINALFSFHQIFPQSLHLLPGFIFFLISAGVIIKIPSLMEKKRMIPIIFGLITLILLFETNISQASSPGTDLPAILFALYIIFLFLSSYEDLPGTPVKVVFISLFIINTVTMKLSVVPIALLFVFLFVWVISRKYFHQITWITGLGLLIMLPWCIRSVMMTGYLFYPVVFPNIITVDWKIPEAALITEQQVIKAWGRMPNADYKEMIVTPFLTWVKPWFFDFSLNRKLMILTAFSLPLSLNIFWINPLRHFFGKAKMRSILIAGSVLSCGLFYWLFSAPDIRFGYTFIIPAASLSLTLAFLSLYRLVFKRIDQGFLIKILIIAVLLFVSQLLIRSLNNDKLSGQWLYPAPYPNLPTMPCEIHEKTILCAELYNECWYTPFPCVPKADPQVEMRGESFQEGFRRIK